MHPEIKASVSSNIIVDEWFDIWLNNVIANRAPNTIRNYFLTVDEQNHFLETAKRSHNYPQYALILETGLRTGEMIGLTWDVMDWEKHTLTVNKTLEFR